jgi:hypothetical protein
LQKRNEADTSPDSRVITCNVRFVIGDHQNLKSRIKFEELL